MHHAPWYHCSMTDRPDLADVDEIDDGLIRAEDVGLGGYEGKRGPLPENITCDFWQDGLYLMVSAMSGSSEVGTMKLVVKSQHASIADINISETWRRRGIATFMKEASQLHLGFDVEHDHDISDEAIQWALTEPGAKHKSWYKANEQRIDDAGW